MDNYICPQCGRDLKRVRYNPDSMLNRDQFFSQVAGDFYCEHCKSDKAKSGYLYFWESSLKDGADVRAWRENVNAQLAAAEARAAKAEGAWAELRDLCVQERAVDAMCYGYEQDEILKDGSQGTDWIRHGGCVDAFTEVLDAMDRLSTGAEVVRVVVPSKWILTHALVHIGALSTLDAANAVDLIGWFSQREGQTVYLVGVRDE